jgi:hypothetical protein
LRLCSSSFAFVRFHPSLFKFHSPLFNSIRLCSIPFGFVQFLSSLFNSIRLCSIPFVFVQFHSPLFNSFRLCSIPFCSISFVFVAFFSRFCSILLVFCLVRVCSISFFLFLSRLLDFVRLLSDSLSLFSSFYLLCSIESNSR